MMEGLGEMAEWLKAPVSKTGSCASATWVRIPLSPFGQANDRPSFVMPSDKSDWPDASHSPRTAAKIVRRDILLSL